MEMACSIILLLMPMCKDILYVLLFERVYIFGEVCLRDFWDLPLATQ